MDVQLLLGLFIFAFITSITPGPNNIMLLASGTNYGVRPTLPHLVGVVIGFALMVFLVGMGLMGIFEVYPIVNTYMKYIGTVYLIYLAWKIGTAVPVDKDLGNNFDGIRNRPFTFLQACLFQWVNPKAWTMAVTAISVYVPEKSSIIGVLLVAIIFSIVNLPTCGAWVIAGAKLRVILNDPLRVRLFNITIALLLVGSLFFIFLI